MIFSLLILAVSLVPFVLLLGLNNFIPGVFTPVVWQAISGPAGILQIHSYTLDEDGLIFDVTHTGTQGRTARIAGKGDHKGTVNASYDADLPPFLPPVGIRFGTVGVIAFAVSPNRAIQIPVIVTKVHYEAAIENEVKYSFDVQENVLVGVIVYPTIRGA